jgi:benzoate-CoA ligase family protein
VCRASLRVAQKVREAERNGRDCALECCAATPIPSRDNRPCYTPSALTPKLQDSKLRRPEKKRISMIQLPQEFNVADYLVDRNIRERRGEKIAIECGDLRVSYRELLERTNRAGNFLRQLGVRRGERVALLLMDTPEFFYCYFGAIKIGAVAVPVNPFQKTKECIYVLKDSAARVVVVESELLAQLELDPREGLPDLKEIVVAGEAIANCVSLKDGLDSASGELEAAVTRRDDPAFWLYSSGSTGSPKACIHLHRDMAVCAELYARNILGMKESDRCYSVARLYFAYGLGNAGYFPLAAGATTILSPSRPSPAGIYADVEKYRPTLFFSVPSNYAALLAHHRENGREFDFSSVRQAVSAGESLPAPLFERFKERFGIEILDSLGSTESLQMVIANAPGDVRAGSSGKIIPGYEAKIVDERGELVEQGEIGNLMIKGDSICAGYWGQAEKTRAAFEDGWFRTGDKYHQDADGYFWYAGRSDDTFKVNGRWLSPAEVESALIAHPAVLEAAVVAREDEGGLTKVAAFVVLKAEFSNGDGLVAELQEWVGSRVGGYKRPRWVEFVCELPKTSTGKLQRFKLREGLKRGR